MAQQLYSEERLEGVKLHIYISDILVACITPGGLMARRHGPPYTESEVRCEM